MIRSAIGHMVFLGGLGIVALATELPFPQLSILQTVDAGIEKVQRTTDYPSHKDRRPAQTTRQTSSLPLLFESKVASQRVITPLLDEWRNDGLLLKLSMPIKDGHENTHTLGDPHVPDRTDSRQRHTSDTDEPKAPVLAGNQVPALPLPVNLSLRQTSVPLGAPADLDTGVVSLLASQPEKPSDETLRSPDTTLKKPSAADVSPEESPSIKKPVVGTAERIAVPSIGIDIAVQPGMYDAATQSWSVDDTSAFHASTTVPVNDTNGTTLIYGHAKWGIFGNLPDISPGAEATVYTSEGMQFVYVLEEVAQIDPSDVSMLTAEGDPRLVLQTCSGFLDQHRTVASFRLKEIIGPTPAGSPPAVL